MIHKFLELLFRDIFGKGNILAASDALTRGRLHSYFFRLVYLSCLSKVVLSGKELDDRCADLVRELTVGALGALSVPRVDLDSAQGCIFNTGNDSLPLGPRVEHISRHPLDQDFSLDFGQFVLNGLRVAH